MARAMQIAHMVNARVLIADIKIPPIGLYQAAKEVSFLFSLSFADIIRSRYGG
jgi:hypothetical protein